MSLRSPLIAATSVSLKWKGLPDSQYEIILSKNPDFTDTFITCCKSFNIHHNRSSLFVIMVLFILNGSLLILVKKYKRWHLVPFIVCVCLLVNCDKEDTTNEETDNTIEFSEIIDELEPNTIYYWKIKSSTSYTNNFFTETATQSFKTLSD